jgi:large subunit ribosomal protein L1
MTKKSKTTEEVKETVVKVEEQAKEAVQKAEEVVEIEKEVDKAERKAKVRSKRYQKAKKLIDINKYYPLKDAVKLIKETSLSKFVGKIEAHINTFDIGNIGDIVFPHLETASKKIVILNDTILAEIKDGKINFDIIIATPTTMPKLLPFAKTLGPKGLMPNPKNGTLTDKPEEAVKKLSVAKTQIKTEKKAPVIHIIVGKTSQEDKEIIANIEELIKIIKPSKIKKLCLCATMGPSIKVEVLK